ncbi:hypothetical protein RB594_002272 [Gaeumannomyces avenae]
MFISPSGDMSLARQVIESRDARSSDSSEVPLWAFVVMTVFSLFLMAFVCLLLWRPDLFRSLQASSSRDSHNNEKPGDGQWQGQCQCARGNSVRRPWFRSGGSFRSNINRWRSGVDSRPPPNAPTEAPTEVYDDEPANNNYAPAPARPVSYMQRIPEGYEQYDQHAQYGNIKPASVVDQRI